MSQQVIKDTPQELGNKSFDPTFQLNTVEIMGYDSANNVMRPIAADANGNIVTTGGFSIPAYDYISYTSNSTSDVYVYKTGGSGGTTVATVTINYTSSSKATISTIERT